jgi:hypothetical protein
LPRYISIGVFPLDWLMVPLACFTSIGSLFRPICSPFCWCVQD